MNGAAARKYVPTDVVIQRALDILLLFFLCAASAHQTGVGIDAILIRASFALYCGASFLACLRNGKIRVSIHFVWLILFLGYYYLSGIWAHDPSYVMRYTNTFIQYLGVTFFLINNTDKKEDIDKIFKLIVIAMLYTVIVLLIKTPVEALGTERVGSALGLHSNGVGFRMSMSAVICMYLVKTGGFAQKVFYSISAVPLVIIAMLTGSKKSIIIIAIGLVLFFMMTTRGVAKRIFVALAIGALLYAGYRLIMINPYLYGVIGRRMESFIDTIGGSRSDGSTLARIFLINIAKQLFWNNMLIGYGANNYEAYLAEIGFRSPMYAHNNYWELLSTLGLIGTFIYYGFLIVLLVSLVRMWLREKFDAMISLALIILIIIAIIDYAMVSYQNEFIHIVIAIAFICYSVRKRERRSINEENVNGLKKKPV